MKNNTASVWPICTALLLLLGHFGPWAQHKTAALTLHGHDLATFTNFTPGAGVFLNEWFYLPLWAAALMLALWATIHVAAWVWRGAIGLLALGIAALGLPTYPEVLSAYRAAGVDGVDYRLQFYVTLLTMVLIVGLLLLGPRLSLRGRQFGVAALPLVAVVPLVGYLVIRPFIAALYNDQIGIGAGWWGTLLAVLLAGWQLWRRRNGAGRSFN